MHINDLLKMASERKASDLHLKVGSHPVLRINGELIPLVETKRLMQEDTIAMAMVSSCMRRLVSTRGMSSPLMRSTGCDPTFRWRSEALRSDAIFKRSLMCIALPPPRAPYRAPPEAAPARAG